MARVIRLFILIGLFLSLFCAAASAEILEHKLADGECVSAVVWEATRDASFWQNDAVHVLHPTEDVEYPKDDYTMRHLPIGTRVRIYEPNPGVDTVPAAASTTGVVVSSPRAISTGEQQVYQPAVRVALASFSLQVASVTSTGADVVPTTATQNYQYPEHHIPLEGWLMIIPCLVALLVCAVHGFNVWREYRARRREMFRPYHRPKGEPILPDGNVGDMDLTFLDSRLADPPPKPVPIHPLHDFELTIDPPPEQPFEVHRPTPPMLN
jgi:hypothetical protein